MTALFIGFSTADLRRMLLWGVVFLLLLDVPVSVAQPATERPRVTNVRPIAAKVMSSPLDVCTLYPGPSHDHPPVLKSLSASSKTATANIEVDYEGFTPEAQAAFQRAVDIWETHIRSSVPIRVDASFRQLDPGVLGGAGPGIQWSATIDGQESIYPDALLDALRGENVSESVADVPDDAPEIVTVFSSEADWYFGEGTPGPSQTDFTTVVLHELGHGLGFYGELQVPEGGSQGEWRFGDVPAIYDRFAENENAASLLNESLYPNPSPQLANVLTSGNVFFSGPETDVAATIEPGPIPVELYAPSTFRVGSSFSHVDEATYPSSDLNALMTPRIGNEVIHQVGPLVCGMFADMGWQLGPSCAAYFNVAVVGFDAEDLGNRQYEIGWAETRVADIDAYELELQYFDEPPVIEAIPSEGAQRYEVSLSSLLDGEVEVGEYAIRLSYIQPDGNRVFVGETEFIIPLRQSFELAEIYPNPFSDRANIKLTVREAQTFRVEVYNALGQQVAVLYDQQRPANDPRPITFDAAKLGTLPSGRYFFRVIGRNFEETRSAVFVR
jgi:hypothetical protein